MDNDPITIQSALDFHRRMAAIIEAVQTGIWTTGLHHLLGHATDYAPGRERGIQTLVLKTRHRSAYVRLPWEAIIGDTPADRHLVEDAIRSAIAELS